MADQVPQLAVLEIAPDALIGIQSGRVGGQPHELDAGLGPGQPLLHRCATMDTRPIPHHQDRARNVSLEMLQEINHGGTTICALLLLDVQLACARHPTDDREMLLACWGMQNGCLTDRRVGAHNSSQEIKCCLVYIDDCSSRHFGFF